MSTTAHPSASDVERARGAVVDVVRHTPVLPSATLTDRLGAPVELKAENLQRTGSFKIRGALAKLHALGDDCAPGVSGAMRFIPALQCWLAVLFILDYSLMLSTAAEIKRIVPA